MIELEEIIPIYYIKSLQYKKIYDEMTEDIFDMSNVRIFNKEIET